MWRFYFFPFSWQEEAHHPNHMIAAHGRPSSKDCPRSLLFYLLRQGNVVARLVSVIFKIGSISKYISVPSTYINLNHAV